MWRVVIRLILMVLFSALALPMGFLLRAIGLELHALKLCMYLSKGLAWAAGLRVIVRGEMSGDRPLLLVSNHISYLDILALSSSAPLTFTPKSEIRNWPIVNWLCLMGGCVFVDRRRSQTKENLANLHQGLDAGKPLLLFAEGSTGNGKHLLPIRSSYFQLAETFDQPLTIQPILIRYERIHNLPVDEISRHRIAWVGDDDLLPHVISLFQMGPVTVSVNFLSEIDVSDCNGRKDIAAKCDQILSDAANNLL